MEPILLKGTEGQRNLLLGRKMHGFCWNKLYRMELIRELLPSYLLSSTFHAGRKFQAILAAITPRLYVRLKNLIHRT